MARILHTPESRADIINILLYLRQRRRQGARRVHLAINNTFKFLAENPSAGQARPELAPLLRSFPVSRYRDYLVFYRPMSGGIQVIRVLHGARNLRRIFMRR